MRKVVVLMVLGMVLAGMAPTAMSEGPYEEHSGWEQNTYPGFYGPDNNDGDHEEQAQCGEQPNQDA